MYSGGGGGGGGGGPTWKCNIYIWKRGCPDVMSEGPCSKP